jgi:hypothetical protein
MNIVGLWVISRRYINRSGYETSDEMRHLKRMREDATTAYLQAQFWNLHLEVGRDQRNYERSQSGYPMF